MIFPVLRGVLSFKLAPVTWSLFFLNVFVFAFLSGPAKQEQKQLQSSILEEEFVKNQGQFYSQYIIENKKQYSVFMQDLAMRAQKGDTTKLEALGGLAVRDDVFMRHGPQYSFRGDKVAKRRWVASLKKIKRLKQDHPSYKMGVSSTQIEPQRWISYQFVHSGFVHLLSNMTFLFIFGCMLEPVIGGLSLLLVYLGGGAVAAGSFLMFNDMSAVPLVGASGAVSALMALFCVLFGRRTVSYFYFLFLPVKGYMGMVYLPAWITLVLWLISDLAGYIGTMSEFGGIAHTAHMGGQLAGVITGLAIFGIRNLQGNWKEVTARMPQSMQVGYKIPLGGEHSPTRQGSILMALQNKK